MFESDALPHSGKKYDYDILMKMPYDYEDRITDWFFEGCLLCDLAKDMKTMGLDGIAFTFQTLAQMKLQRMKVMLRICK